LFQRHRFFCCFTVFIFTITAKASDGLVTVDAAQKGEV